MALQYVHNLIMETYPLYMREATTNFTMDAAGESCAVVGKVALQGGATGKTISAAGGGRIFWRPSTTTFANGGSNLRIGICDLSSGLDDGTFDVYADLTGGGGGITAGVINNVALTSGTKAVGTGSTIAFAIELTTRGGADSLTARGLSAALINGESDLGVPYGTNDVGAGIVRVNTRLPWLMIRTDDGTYGWMEGATCFPLTNAAIAFNEASTPDEYCAVFTPAYTLRVSDIGFPVYNTGASDSFALFLYQDPLGTATLLDSTGSISTFYSSATGGVPNTFALTASQVLYAGVTYGISIAAGASNVSIPYVDLGSGNDGLKACLPFGNVRMAGRSNGTGSFSVVQDYYVPYAFMRVTGLDDGAGLIVAQQSQLIAPYRATAY